MSSQTQFSQTDLVFKFVGGKNDGCVVPVSTSKCLLGKDQNNNAKCAVFRSSRGTTIKSLDESARINGHPFDVCWLRQGDQLTIGNSVLEVQQLGQGNEAVSEQEIPQEERPDQQPLITAQEEQILSPLNSVASEIDSELKDSGEAAVISPADSVEMIRAGNESNSKTQVTEPLAHSADVPARQANHEQTNVVDSQESRPSSALEAYERLTNRLFDEEASQEDGQDSVNPMGAASELSEQLNAMMGSMTGGSESPVAENEASENVRHDSQTAGDEISTEALLARVKNQLAETTNDNSHNSPELSSDASDSPLPTPLQPESAAPSSLEGVLPEGSILEQFAVEAPDSETQPKPESVQQESVADILARMQENGKLDSDFEPVETEPEQVEAATTAPDPASEPAIPEANADPNGEDDSVQAYMNNLFQRLRGGDASYQSPAEGQEKKDQPEQVAAEAPVSAEPTPPASILTPDEFKPKARAPERVANMGAMRELANAQARTAILLSQSKRRKAITLTCLGIVAFGLGMAGYTFAIAKGLDIAFMIGAGCVLISCIAGYRCASAFLGWDLEKIDTKGFGDEAMVEQAVEELQRQAELAAAPANGSFQENDTTDQYYRPPAPAPVAQLPTTSTPPNTPGV